MMRFIVITFLIALSINISAVFSQSGLFPIVTLPYYDDFDSGPSLWVDSVVSGSTSWHLGDPTAFTPYSPPNSWRTAISPGSGYGSNANCYLYSPLFNFQSPAPNTPASFSAPNTVNTKLSFWQNSFSENFWDGFRIEYNIIGVGESPWRVLGEAFDPNGTNWYNYYNLNASDLPGWSGNTNGWIESTLILKDLNNINGYVQFRFVFNSDNSVQFSGATIDNFSLNPPNISPRYGRSLESSSIIIYPNPSDNWIQIITTKEIGAKTISIFNSVGDLVHRKNYNGNEYKLYKSDLSEGLYFYQITSNMRHIYSGKIIFK